VSLDDLLPLAAGVTGKVGENAHRAAYALSARRGSPTCGGQRSGCDLRTQPVPGARPAAATASGRSGTPAAYSGSDKNTLKLECPSAAKRWTKPDRVTFRNVVCSGGTGPVTWPSADGA
jgi:hypothetical protein